MEIDKRYFAFGIENANISTMDINSAIRMK